MSVSTLLSQAEPPAQLTGSGYSLETIFSNVLAVSVPIAGIALFVVLLNAGFKFMSSGGDPKKTGDARTTMTFAIGGLVIIATGYLILRFISYFTGQQGILNFVLSQ